MKWSFFLHFYQPYNQQKDILERVVNESYRKILLGLARNPSMKLNLNINAGLTELLAKNGYNDIIEQIKDCAIKGQIEFVGSAKYHPFLPLLPVKEIKRQIDINTKTNKKYFGKVYNPVGFFSPEMAYNTKVGKAIRQAGFDWVLLEELSALEKQKFQKIYKIKDVKNLKVVFRDKRASNLILSAITRNMESFISEFGHEEINKNRYLLTLMDAETFGHHRPGLEKFLFEIYEDKQISKVFISKLIKEFSVNEKIKIRPSTWSAEEQDFWLKKEKKHSFSLWSDPKNPIHKLQWDFTYFVIELVNKASKKQKHYKKTRMLLDKALHSDQYWWASARPWWSLEMIEQGAFDLKKVVLSITAIPKNKQAIAEDYYNQILGLAFKWQRQGKIRNAYREEYKTLKQKSFKKRVLAGQFNSMILEFEDEMNKAIKNKEFEKAIKWRDAIYKLKADTDIFDVLHVVDDLANHRNLPSLKDYWEYDVQDFSKFAKENFVSFNEKKFQTKQPKQLFDEIKLAFLKKEESHPLGFFRDKYNVFHICEVPSNYIEYYVGTKIWDAMSLLKFKKHKKYHSQGQCDYEYFNNKLKITINAQSLLNKFLILLKQSDISQGKYLKVAVLCEKNQYKPIFFSKNKQNQLIAIVPYKYSSKGVGIKYKIFNWVSKK